MTSAEIRLAVMGFVSLWSIMYEARKCFGALGRRKRVGIRFVVVSHQIRTFISVMYIPMGQCND
jgi:hypothetical protein